MQLAACEENPKLKDADGMFMEIPIIMLWPLMRRVELVVLLCLYACIRLHTYIYIYIYIIYIFHRLQTDIQYHDVSLYAIRLHNCLR